MITIDECNTLIKKCRKIRDDEELQIQKPKLVLSASNLENALLMFKLDLLFFYSKYN